MRSIAVGISCIVASGLCTFSCGGNTPPVCAGSGSSSGTGGAGATSAGAAAPVGGGPAIAAPVGTTGELLSLSLSSSSGSTFLCDGTATAKSAESVTVRVLGPDNRPVPDVTSKLNGGSFGFDTASVSFTPTQPGPYHVEVMFEPSLSLQQTDVWVALDRRQAAPAFATNQRCTHYAVSPSGTWWCGTEQSLRATLSDGGTHLFATRVGQYLLAQDTVWAYSPDAGMQRFHETSEGFALDTDAPCALSPATWSGVGGTAASIVVATPFELRELHVEARACVKGRAWPNSSGATVGSLIAWSGERGLRTEFRTDLFATSLFNVVSIFIDGGIDTATTFDVWSGGNNQLVSTAGSTLTTHEADGSQTTHAIPAGWVPVPTLAGRAAPILVNPSTNDRLVVSTADGGLTLERWAAPVDVTTDFVVGDGGVFYRR